MLKPKRHTSEPILLHCRLCALLSSVVKLPDSNQLRFDRQEDS